MHRIGLLLVSLLVVTLVACGGDADEPEPTPGVTATPVATAEPTPNVPANEAFDQLAAGFEDAEFAVTYRTETALDEPPFTGEPVTSEWEWKQSGESSRFDFDGAMVGFEGTMTIIATPEEAYICVGMGCLGSPPDLPIYGSPSGPLSEAVQGIRAQVSSGSVTEAESRQIAGVEARCFDFTGGTGGASGSVCLSESGVPLFADIEAESGSIMLEALEYSDTVDPTEFDPPHDVTGI